MRSKRGRSIAERRPLRQSFRTFYKWVMQVASSWRCGLSEKINDVCRLLMRIAIERRLTIIRKTITDVTLSQFILSTSLYGVREAEGENHTEPILLSQLITALSFNIPFPNITLAIKATHFTHFLSSLALLSNAFIY